MSCQEACGVSLFDYMAVESHWFSKRQSIMKRTKEKTQNVKPCTTPQISETGKRWRSPVASGVADKNALRVGMMATLYRQIDQTDGPEKPLSGIWGLSYRQRLKGEEEDQPKDRKTT